MFYLLNNISNKFSLQGQHLSFSSIPMSLMRTFAMMLGEIDFVGTYVQPYYKSESDIMLPFPMPTFFILGLFMVLMPILLMNLLIGLAVGDIESVRRNAQLKRLAMQVEYSNSNLSVFGCTDIYSGSASVNILHSRPTYLVKNLRIIPK